MQVKLSGVRFNYCRLYEPSSFDGDPDKAKYSCTLLIEKGSKTQKLVDEKINEVAIEKWGEDKGPKLLKKLRSDDKVCLRVGDEKLNRDGEVVDGFADHLYINASNAQKPIVLNANKEEVTAENQSTGPKSGDYGSAVIRLWAQDNQWGQRINAQLDYVLLARRGDSLGGGSLLSADQAADQWFDDDETVPDEDGLDNLFA